MLLQAARRTSLSAAAAVALVVSLSFVGVSGTTEAAHAQALTSSSTLDPGKNFARKILKIVNKKRANHGKRKLHAQRCDSRRALRWGNHLADTNTWEHSNLYKLLDKCNMSGAAENLAQYPDGMTPRQVVKLWMHSSGHRQNILNGKYGLSGVAVIWDSDQKVWYAVQNFTHR